MTVTKTSTSSVQTNDSDERFVCREVYNAVLDRSKTTGTVRLFMTVLARWANKEGCCWPSWRTIAYHLKRSEKTAKRCAKTAASLGELRIDTCAGPSGSNKFYILILNRMSPPPRGSEIEGQSCPGGGSVLTGLADNPDPSGGSSVSPKLINELNRERIIEVGTGAFTIGTIIDSAGPSAWPQTEADWTKVFESGISSAFPQGEKDKEILQRIQSQVCTELWQRAQEILKAKIDPQTYNTWVAPMRCAGFEEATLSFRVPNQYFVERLERMRNEIVMALPRFIGDVTFYFEDE